MSKLAFTVVFVLIPLISFGQINYKIGITYTQPRFIKSPGLAFELGNRNNSIQVSSSMYLHSPVPNQTVNSVSIEDIGFYDYGFAYLRSIHLEKLSIGVGAGFGVIRGPIYRKIYFYEQGGYNIYRVEREKFTFKTLNLNFIIRKIYILSTYNIEEKSVRFGVGIKIK